MKLKDLVTNSIYRWTNQKLQTVLLWKTAIIEAVNFALNDIYTYEGKEWTFMYKKEELNWDETNDKTIFKTLQYPIKKLFRIYSKDRNYKPNTPWHWDTEEYKIVFAEPTVWIEDLHPFELYFKPWTYWLYVPNNKNSWYIVHYVSFFNKIDWEDEIPLPDHFLWTLYNLTMTYLYPIDWEYWDNKDANCYNKAQTQLVNLAKTDAFQMQWVIWNIH